jgi:hypothetical protein
MMEEEIVKDEMDTPEKQGLKARWRKSKNKTDSSSKTKASSNGKLVLLIGLVLLGGVAFLFVKSMLDDIERANASAARNPPAALSTPMDTLQSNPLQDAQSKPIVYDKPPIEPPETIVTKAISATKTASSKANIQAQRKEARNMPTVSTPSAMVPSQKPREHYSCILLPRYAHLVNQEIVYFSKRSGEYVPAFKMSDWDQTGFRIQKTTESMSLDKVHKMVKIAVDKWVPLLEIAQCIPSPQR